MAALSRAGLYASVAVLLTWPAALHPFDLVPGAGRTDLWNSLWSLWFVAEALMGGQLPFATTLLDHPRGGVLVVADPLNALIALPLVATLGVSFAYSALILGHVLFSGVAADRLALALGCGPAGALAAGVGYQSAPVLLSGIHNGTSESVAGGWLALSLLFALRAAQRGGVWRIAGAGLALAVCALGSFYAGVGAWLALLALAVVGLSDVPRPRLLARLAGVAVVGLLLTLPYAWLSHRGATDPANLVGIKHAHELDSVRRTVGAADPRVWLRPGDWRSPDFREISRYGEEFIHCTYLGWTLLLAAAVGLARRRGRLAWLLVLAGLGGAVLATGPVVVQDGQPLVVFTDRVIGAPYFLLERLPGFESLSLIYRLGTVTALAVALLAGRALAGRPASWGLAFVALVLIEGRLIAPTAGLPHVEDASIAPPLEWLASAPEGAVMNFPVVGGRGYLYEQVTHQKPLTGALNFPNNHSSKKVWAAMLGAVEQGMSGEAFRQAVLRAARKQGIRYVVVHTDPEARPDMHDAAVAELKVAFPAAQEHDGLGVHALW